MTVPQIRQLSGARLHKAQKYSGLTLEQFAFRVRGFHPDLRGTNVKQLTRWHGGQRPRQPELVVAAYVEITGRDEAFFYATADEDEEEAALLRIALELEARGPGNEDIVQELFEMAACEPVTRERKAVKA